MEIAVQLVHLEMVVDRSIIAPVRQIRSPADASACVGPFIRGRAQETVAVLALDVKNHPLAVGLVSVGSVDRAALALADLFRFALLSNAAHMILVHNHPSGDLVPSPQDWAVTEDASAVAAWLGLAITDHLILGPDREFCSLRLLDPDRFTGVARKRTRSVAAARTGRHLHVVKP
jgi:DNA repair protein RadC